MALAVTHNTQATGTDAGNGEIHKAQWNEAHALAGQVDDTQLDQTKAYVFSGLGAAMISGVASGSVPLTISGLSLTGSQQQSFINLSGTWNTSGAPTGILFALTDTAAAAASNLIDIQRNTVSQFKITRAGTTTVKAFSVGTNGVNISAVGGNGFNTTGGGFIIHTAAGTLRLSDNNDTNFILFGFPTTNSLALGGPATASPVNQLFTAQSSRAGTDSNVGGANLTVAAGPGTGTGTISSLVLQSPVAVASGTGAQTQTTGLTIKGGQAVLPTYTVATLPTGIAGGMAYVTDGDAGLAWGATVINSGAGATKYQVWFNNANWTVTGK